MITFELDWYRKCHIKIWKWKPWQAIDQTSTCVKMAFFWQQIFPRKQHLDIRCIHIGIFFKEVIEWVCERLSFNPKWAMSWLEQVTSRWDEDDVCWILIVQASVPITTNINCEFESREVYSIQHYVVKFVSELRQDGGYLLVLSFLHQ
jgi:hypothetical protein